MFEAKYPGTCAGCTERIEVGDLITSDCDSLPPLDRKPEVCATCWLTKPCDCESA